MKSFILICLVLGICSAQQFPWLNSFPCNECYGPSFCFNEADNLPQQCTQCLQNKCESQLELLSLASEGIECIRQAWQDPLQCQEECPAWNFYHYWRTSRCQNCLRPCVATIFDSGAGQCNIKELVNGGSDPCVSETRGACGTCYRANQCFTERELNLFGGICKDYLKLKCPDLKNITCLKNAFAEPCSTCPPSTLADVRFQACEVCIDQCTAKQQCLDGCRNNLPKNPTQVSCPLCRAFCKVNPFDPDCEEKRCDCETCDTCYERCDAMEGGNFNLFNPCECLNDEENAPVMTVTKGRILGGSNTCEGDWPWVVHIYNRGRDPLESLVCGGTLFNNQWVVTAAHCFETPDPSLYSVILGEHILSVTSGREVFRDVIRLQRHPSFDSQTFNYDVAVIKLSEKVTFTEYIQPLAIAPPGTRTDNTNSPSFAGRLCTTVGWGVTTSRGRVASNTLMQLGLRITPRVLCEFQTLTGYEQGPVLPPRPGAETVKFCAGGVGGEDSCNGDSGGSLFCLHDDGNYVLHGITSYGTPDCGQEFRPGIYTKVAEVSNWISMCINRNQCNPTTL